MTCLGASFLLQAPLNYGTILSTLGLTQPAAAQSTYGVATVVGPLTQCNVSAQLPDGSQGPGSGLGCQMVVHGLPDSCACAGQMIGGRNGCKGAGSINLNNNGGELGLRHSRVNIGPP